MKSKDIKVFHGLVNYGSQAGLLAKSLRKQFNISTISVSNPDRFKRIIDVELLHGGNFFSKMFKHAYNFFRKIFWFFRYNTFHFYYGVTLFPYQIDLPLYRLFGKKVIMHYLGKDVKTYKESVERYEISNMFYSVESEKIGYLNDSRIKKRLAFESRFVSLQLVCSPVYLEYVENSYLFPLAIDLSRYKYSPINLGECITILHAPTSRSNKGTVFINDAVGRLIDKGYTIEYLLVENVKHSVLQEMYLKCDIFVDQVLGGYGTAAIEAMAIGRPTVSYLRDQHFNDDIFPGGVPIIRANKDDIFEVLEELIINKQQLQFIGLASRKFVETYHDVSVLSNKLFNIYKSLHNLS